MKFLKNNVFVFVLAFFLFHQLDAQDDLYLKGIASIDKKEYQQAVQSFDEVLQNSPGNIDALQKRGEAFYSMGNYEKALADFENVDQQKSAYSSIWISRCYAQNGNIVKAMDALAEHLKSPYKLPRKDIFLEPAFQKIENTREWRNFWRKDWYRPYETQKAEAQYLIQKEQSQEALELLNVLLNQNDDDASLYYLRSKAYSQMTMYSEARANLNLAVSKAPDETFYRHERAELYLQMNRYEDALDDYSVMLKKSPDNFDLYLERANILLYMHDYKPALNDVKSYLKFFEDDVEAMFLAGEINYKSGDYYEAIRSFNKVLDQDQTNEKYFVARGNTYIKLHTFEYAANDLSMALDLNPENPEIFLARGIAQLGLNLNKRACHDFKKAFNMGEKKALDYLQKYCDY